MPKTRKYFESGLRIKGEERRNNEVMTYTIEYGVYINCHISGTESIEIEAETEEEARQKAQEYLDAEEQAEMEQHKGDDVWMPIEDIYPNED